MPTAVIALLSALAVLLHALLGCCWHHPHTPLASSPDQAIAGSAVVAGSAHQTCDHGGHSHAAPRADAHAQPGKAPSPREEDPHPCGESHCVFLSSSGPVLPDLDPGPGVSALPLAAVVVALLGRPGEARHLVPHARAYSVQGSCALRQVWLI